MTDSQLLQYFLDYLIEQRRHYLALAKSIEVLIEQLRIKINA
jgi:hypothetical protein